MFPIKARQVLTILLFWNSCDKWFYYCCMVTFKLCIQCSICYLYQGSALLAAKTATCAPCIPSNLFPTTFTQTPSVLRLHSRMLLLLDPSTLADLPKVCVNLHFQIVQKQGEIRP